MEGTKLASRGNTPLVLGIGERAKLRLFVGQPPNFNGKLQNKPVEKKKKIKNCWNCMFSSSQASSVLKHINKNNNTLGRNRQTRYHLAISGFWESLIHNLIVSSFHLKAGSSSLFIVPGNSRTIVSFQGVAFMADKDLWFFFPLPKPSQLQRPQLLVCSHTIFYVWFVHASQSIVRRRDYHTVDALITGSPAPAAHLKLTRIGAVKQSEVTHIVMQ